MANKGKVYIMGVGPGDYKLITLKAKECIEKADVIVYDRLISSKILRLAKTGAELIYVGKMPDCHAVPQDGINDILVEKALEGKTVARVKGGDPFVFGRGGEEAMRLRDNGIEFEIIPGVTSAVAVPAYAGIPVTHRDFCSSLHIITGHERPDKNSSLLDYEVLAKVSGTLVFLMGIRNLGEIAENLMKSGKAKETPVAVVQQGTTVYQKVVTGTLEDIAKKVCEQGIKSPAVTVIGEVVSLEKTLSWFQKGLLAEKRIVVTRAREQASKLVDRIEELGGEVFEFPTIKTALPESFSKLDEVLKKLQSYNWIVFSSVNGVKYFFDRMREVRVDIRKLSHVKLCAVGTTTAEELEARGLLVDLLPEKYTSEYLLKELCSKAAKGERVLVARPDIAGDELAKGLQANGIEVDDIEVYRTLPDAWDKAEILQLLEEGKIDFITFTSSSTVKNFVSAAGAEYLQYFSKLKAVCIVPSAAASVMVCSTTS